MNRIGEFKVQPFSLNHQISSDFVALGQGKHHMTALLEFDVTETRRAIREYRRRTGQGLSLLAWMAKCIAQAVSENKEVNAYRHGSRRLVIFDDVDISIVVERVVDGAKTPVPCVLRKVNEKDLAQIYQEITSAKTAEVTETRRVLGEGENPWYIAAAYLLTASWRRFILAGMMRNAFRVKKIMGTVVITSIGMFGKTPGWALPSNPLHTLCFALGGINKKPGVVKDRIEIREYLTVTVMIDHDIIDGAPAARFMARLIELVEKGPEPQEATLDLQEKLLLAEQQRLTGEPTISLEEAEKRLREKINKKRSGQ